VNRRRLLDVNVLLALAWAGHVHHDLAHERFAELDSWSTTPITELGLVRLMLTEPVVGRVVRASEALDQLRAFRAADGWSWIPDYLSPTDWAIAAGSLRGRRQVTDLQLVNLAGANDCVLATFDARIPEMLLPQNRALVEVWR
jgi:toxin-antitoxin system PIN domain toxin